MQKTVYEDFKYHLQDTGRIYVGCKYTFQELTEVEDLLFKFRIVMERYVMPDADPEDTLETHLYYLPEKSPAVKVYRQLKARVKVNLIQEKKGIFGKGKRAYVTRVMPVEELVKIPPGKKEEQGLVVQELSVSKLAVASL